MPHARVDGLTINYDVQGEGDPLLLIPYGTDAYADQLAAFLGEIGIERAHVAGVSLGAAVATHLDARHPGRMRSLSLHSAWDRTDGYLRAVLELWRSVANGLAHCRRRGDPGAVPVLLHA